MTKRELIELLKDYSDDTPILVHGHSDGSDYNDSYGVELMQVKAYKTHSKNGFYWTGQYTTHTEYPEASEYLHPDTIEAVVIH